MAILAMVNFAAGFVTQWNCLAIFQTDYKHSIDGHYDRNCRFSYSIFYTWMFDKSMLCISCVFLLDNNHESWILDIYIYTFNGGLLLFVHGCSLLIWSGYWSLTFLLCLIGFSSLNLVPFAGPLIYIIYLISRSVAGRYDNEAVAIFALIFTFYL